MSDDPVTHGSPDGQPSHAGPFEGPGTSRTAGAPGKLAAALVAAQALALLGFAGFYLVQLARGEGGQVTRVLMSAVVIVAFALALIVVARALWRGLSWSRSATAVWQVLLIPVGVSLIQSGQLALGAVVLFVAALTLAALAMDRRPGS